MKGRAILFNLLLMLHSAAFCNWNNPHVENGAEDVLYSAISGSPKTLDPAKAYSADEIEIISQIYEPVLQYHPTRKPYQLIPLTALQPITVSYYASDGSKLTLNAPSNRIAKTVYDIKIRPHIYYQPHPAFAKNSRGELIYRHLNERQMRVIHELSDFKQTGTRELQAADYVYEINRLASPRVNSPIFGLMNKYIIGLKELSVNLAKDKSEFLDLRHYSIEGAKVLGPYHFQISINGIYPQFIYWLAMTFFVPIPWEADEFYSQPGMEQRNISFSWYPVGTGPYLLAENNPNKQMVLAVNPNYTAMKNRSQPFIKKVILELDKESIPRWNKFLQGYYDKSGVGADSFDQAIKIDKNGKVDLTPEMREKGIHLQIVVEPGVFYTGFNMLDPVVGGAGERAKLLRRAIAIAFDNEEFISIFLNGRGIPAQGPISPGIFGYEEGDKGRNPYVYDWVNGRLKRKSLAEARQLLAQAGYRGGIDPATKKALILNYDVATTGNPDDKAHFDWLRQQFAKLGIRLNIRATLYNTFQDKVQRGEAQIFSWGWMADYPDPENFLFLMYGPNGKVKYGGENATNYSNPKADALYEEIRVMPDGIERQNKINQLLAILREDSPLIWGFHPVSFTLSHQWNTLRAPNPMLRNGLKYEKLNPELRKTFRDQWNQPIVWPWLILTMLLLIIVVPLVFYYRRRERSSTVQRIREDEK